MNHETMMDARAHVLRALTAAMDERAQHRDDWVEHERAAVVSAANTWASLHGVRERLTVEDVVQLETSAVGHVDYASKLALRVAEWLVGVRVPGSDKANNDD